MNVPDLTRSWECNKVTSLLIAHISSAPKLCFLIQEYQFLAELPPFLQNLWESPSLAICILVEIQIHYSDPLQRRTGSSHQLQRATSPKCTPFCWQLTPRYKGPIISALSGQLGQGTCNPELPTGLAEALSVLHHSLTCLSASCPSLHKHWVLINILYTKLHLSICFLRTKLMTWFAAISSWPSPENLSCSAWPSSSTPAQIHISTGHPDQSLHPQHPVSAPTVPCETERTAVPLRYAPSGGNVSLSSHRVHFLPKARRHCPNSQAE